MSDLSSWKVSRYHERSECMCSNKVTSFLKKNPMLAWGLFVLLVVLAVYFAALKCFLEQPLSDEATTGWEKLAQFGDSFGALNTLFTGLAFAGLLVTIWIQNKQIKSVEDQNKKQLFETEIQNLLALLHQKKQSIAIRRGEGINNWERPLITGNAALIEIINSFIYTNVHKDEYEKLKQLLDFFREIIALNTHREKVFKYEEEQRCIKYDIGEFKSWVSTYLYCICRIDEYCTSTKTDTKRRVGLNRKT